MLFDLPWLEEAPLVRYKKLTILEGGLLSSYDSRSATTVSGLPVNFLLLVTTSLATRLAPVSFV